jgi:hypothetical protein
MDVTMPDGTIVKGVPKGTTQAELKARYDKYTAAKPAAPAAPAAPATESPTPLGRAAHVGGMVAGGVGAAAGFIPGMTLPTDLFKYAVTGEKPDYAGETDPSKFKAVVPGAYGGADPRDVRRLEQSFSQSANLERMTLDHPSIIPVLGKAVVTGMWSTWLKGWNATNMKEAYEGGETLVNAATAVYQSYKGAQWAYTAMNNLSKDAKLMRSLKGKNAKEIEEILRGYFEDAKQRHETAQGAKEIAENGVQDMKDALHRHATEQASADLNHQRDMAHQQIAIDDARKSLDDKKGDELERIRASHEAAKAKADADRAARLKEIHDNHKGAAEESKRAYEEAKEAAEKLAKENLGKLTDAEKKMYRQRLKTYIRRVNSNNAASKVGLPKSEQLFGADRDKNGSLSGRLINYFTDYFKAESEKIKDNPIFKNLNARIQELRDNGELWGRSESGLKLRQELRSERFVKAGEGESDISSFMRQQIDRVLGKLEQNPEPFVDAAGNKIRPAAVPVKGEDVFNIVREIRNAGFGAKRANSPRANELLDLADKIESSFSDFVGEGYDVRKQYAQLMENMNQLEQLDVPQAAIGYKEADYIPVDKRDRKVNRTDVASRIFSGDNNIKQLRRLMVERAKTPEEATAAEAQFNDFLDHHLSNTLSNMSYDDVVKWLTPETGGGAWIDEINEPSLRPKLEQYAINLGEEEGYLKSVPDRIKKLKLFIETKERDLDTGLSEIAGLTKEGQKPITPADIEKQRKGSIREAIKRRRDEGAERRVEKVSEEGIVKAEARQATTEAKQTADAAERALAESLVPQEQAIKEQVTARTVSRAQRKLEKVEAKAQKNVLQMNLGELRTLATDLGGKAEQYAKIMDNLDVLLNSNPRVASGRFKKYKSKLIQSGLMTAEDAASLESMYAADAVEIEDAREKMKRQIKFKSLARKAVLIGLGAFGASEVKDVWDVAVPEGLVR